MGGFIKTFCHNQPFEVICELDMTQNDDEFDTQSLDKSLFIC